MLLRLCSAHYQSVSGLTAPPITYRLSATLVVASLPMTESFLGWFTLRAAAAITLPQSTEALASQLASQLPLLRLREYVLTLHAGGTALVRVGGSEGGAAAAAGGWAGLPGRRSFAP